MSTSSVLVQTYAAAKVLSAELQVAAANKFLRRMRILASECERAVSGVGYSAGLTFDFSQCGWSAQLE